MRLTVEKTKRFEVPNDPDGAYINIKALSLEQLARIESKCSKSGMDEDGNFSVSLDPFKRANAVSIACLTGWGGFFDVKGKELKFSVKNLREAAGLGVMMPDEDKPIRLFEWVDQCHNEFLDEIDTEAVEAAKN